MSRYKLSDSAKRDLRALSLFIARRNREAAKQWAGRLRARIRAAARMPRAGRRVPEYDDHDVREVFVGNYRIQYRVSAKEILIICITEGHRLLGPLPDDE